MPRVSFAASLDSIGSGFMCAYIPSLAITSGVTTTTTYALVPESKVVLEKEVGHKVEVSGVLAPAGKGDTKFKSRTKTGGTEEKTKGEVERGPLPQLKVLSIRQLAERCNP